MNLPLFPELDFPTGPAPPSKKTRSQQMEAAAAAALIDEWQAKGIDPVMVLLKIKHDEMFAILSRCPKDYRQNFVVDLAQAIFDLDPN